MRRLQSTLTPPYPSPVPPHTRIMHPILSTHAFVALALSTNIYTNVYTWKVWLLQIWLGIRGTQVKSSIQDIVDEVAPIKKAPLWG